MQNKGRRIIIDTNLWISFLITKDYSRLDELLFSRKAVLLFSQELLDEFIAVAGRPKFRRFFAPEDIEAIIETIADYADFVQVYSDVDVCRDPKDNFLLTLSKDGRADYLITGDRDLLELKKIEHTQIITITELLES